MRDLYVATIFMCILIVKRIFCQSTLRDPQSSSTILSTASLQSCVSKIKDPVVVPLKDVALANGTIHRGLELTYGTPPQTFAMALSSDDNNTYLFDTQASCSPGDSNLGCIVREGGRFDMKQSSTFVPYTNLTAPGMSPIQASDIDINDTSGTDVLILDPTTRIPDFPIGFYKSSRQWIEGPHVNRIGVASDSSMMRALIDSNAIDSRTFGYYRGSDWPSTSAQTDGALVFGGYDQAKASGPNQTFQMNHQDCPWGLKVTVSGMTMNLKNGTNTSIIGPEIGSAYGACISLSECATTIPQDLWGRFLEVSGSTETGRTTNLWSYWTMLIDAATAYTGDLTIKLEPGFELRIPNDKLIVPEYDMNDDGQTYIKNTSNRNVLLYSLQDVNRNDMPLIGKSILSLLYLFVDYDQDHFLLWQGKPTNDSKLIAIGPSACATPTSGSTTMAAPAMTSSTDSSGSHDSLSKGGIAGSVIGGSFAVTICLIISFVLIKRDRRPSEMGDTGQKFDQDGNEELQASRIDIAAVAGYAPQEVPVEAEPPCCLAPYELATRERLLELAARGTLNELATHEPTHEMP